MTAVNIEICATAELLNLIRRAAAASQMTPEAFMLEASVVAAHDALGDLALRSAQPKWQILSESSIALWPRTMQFENCLLADRPWNDESLTYSSHARRSKFANYEVGRA